MSLVRQVEKLLRSFNSRVRNNNRKGIESKQVTRSHEAMLIEVCQKTFLVGEEVPFAPREPVMLYTISTIRPYTPLLNAKRRATCFEPLK